MIRKSIAAAFLALTQLVGVAFAGDYPHGTVITERDGGTLGSFVQWTDSVAVTADHVRVDVKAAGIACADVKFFAHKGAAPKWDTAKVGEKVVASGSTVSNARIVSRQSAGAVLETSLLVCDGGAQLFTFDAPVTEGMSGGPVYRVSDGAVVGITRGYLTEKAEVEGSVMVPYHTIKAAWDFLNAQGQLAQLLPSDNLLALAK